MRSIRRPRGASVTLVNIIFLLINTVMSGFLNIDNFPLLLNKTASFNTEDDSSVPIDSLTLNVSPFGPRSSVLALISRQTCCLQPMTQTMTTTRPSVTDKDQGAPFVKFPILIRNIYITETYSCGIYH